MSFANHAMVLVLGEGLFLGQKGIALMTLYKEASHGYFGKKNYQRWLWTLEHAELARRGMNAQRNYSVRRTAPIRMRGPTYPILEAQTSRREKRKTPLRPRRWDYRSPALIWKVASPQQKPKNWHQSCSTIYLAAVRTTSSCSQDIRE